MTDEEIEKKKNEALVDYNIANKEFKTRYKRIIKIILGIVLIFSIIAILIRVFHGRVYYSVSFLALNKSVEYNLYINGEHKSVSFEDTEDNPIIPGLLYFRRSNYGGWFNMDKLNEDLIFKDEKIELEFVVSECYTHTDKIRVACDSTNDKLVRKKVTPKFTNIFIRKNGKKEKVMYDGKFINDISKYVKEKGYYYIEIDAKYDGIDTKLYLFPRRLEDV